MKLSILHISDLHRDPTNPIRNDVLLDSLENDRIRYCNDAPQIRTPDLIIVSGDIIHGINADIAEPEKALQVQYQEAFEFLTTLAKRFLNSDRSRIVIIPGNHDISAYHFFKSLKRLDIPADRKKDIVTALFRPESLLRWSWTDLELFEISDTKIYADRLQAFVEFYRAFYEGRRSYELDPTKQFDIFDYPTLGLTIAAFSSCYNNDLFNRQGAIHPACLAAAGTILRDSEYQDRIRLAVWHHNAEGAPMQSDYMDADFIQHLIDRGISIGFHGHQHRPQYLDTRFRHGADRGITVISAGTLCGGPAFRFGRSYNVVELDTASLSGRLHVREMQNDSLNLPIWGRRALPPATSPYFDFKFDLPPKPIVQLNAITEALRDAQNFYDRGDIKAAADILKPLAGRDELARRLLLEYLVELRDSPTLISIYDPPRSSAEAIHLMDALWESQMTGRLGEVLLLPIIAGSADTAVIELKTKYTSKLRR